MMDDGHSRHIEKPESVVYTCPMYPEVHSSSPGTCPKCGMHLVPVEKDHDVMAHHSHEHEMKPTSQMSRWEQFKMSMTMTMGMEHTGVAGREMARLMELYIRQKFSFALILSLSIILHSPLGKFIFGFQPPAPVPVPRL